MKLKINSVLKLIKTTFWQQFYILIFICVFGALFNHSLIHKNHLLAVISGVTLWVFSSIGTTLVVPGLLENLWMGFSHHWKAKEIPILPEINELAQKMSVSNFSLKIRDDINNAYAYGNDIVIGKPFLEKLTNTNALAVIAHEFEHKKGKHVLKITLALYLLVIVPAINYLALPKTIQYVCMTALIIVVRTPLSWLFEKKADKVAAKYLGNDAMIDALLAISEDKNRDEPSLSHPSINDRIENLRKEK